MNQIKNQKNNTVMDSINMQVQMIANSKNILNLGGLLISDILKEKRIIYSEIQPKLNLKISDYLDKLSLEKLWDNELSNLENKYDVIILNDLLEQTREPGLLLENLKNFLSENGSIIASTKNLSSFINICEILKGNISQNNILHENFHIYDLDGVILFLNNRNFSISEIKRIKQEFDSNSNYNFTEYVFPSIILESLQRDPESNVISYVFRIINKCSVDTEIRNWLNEFSKNYFLESIKNKFEYYTTLTQIIKDKDAHTEQIIKDKDAHTEQIIKDKNDIIKHHENALNDYIEQINEIKNSKSWKILHKFDKNND